MYNDPISCGAEKKQNFKQMSKQNGFDGANFAFD